MPRYDRESGFKVASFKARDGAKSGEFEALVSVFGNIDHDGDRVMPGAFAKSLARWRESGDPIPVIWNHQWGNPAAHIGKVDPNEAEETAEGLLVKGVLDLDNEFAAQVHRLLSERRVKELSFGYNLIDSERGKNGTLDLLELDLIEVGPTLKGANPETQVVAVKAFDLAQTKAGARLSKESRAAVQQARDLLDTLLSTDDAPKESEVEETKSDEAEALGKASDRDLDLITKIQLLKET